MIFKRATTMIFAALVAACAPACAAGESGPDDIFALEGDWEVVDTTWGGDKDDFIGSVYTIKIDRESVSSPGGVTEFLVDIDSDDSSGTFQIKAHYCVMRYALLKDSFKFFRGYPRPIFWRLDRYPCGPDPAGLQDPDKVISIKYLIRFILEGEDSARALVYYDNLYYKYAVDEEEGETPPPPGECEGWYCRNSITFGAGAFELDLKKVVRDDKNNVTSD